MYHGDHGAEEDPGKGGPDWHLKPEVYEAREQRHREREEPRVGLTLGHGVRAEQVVQPAYDGYASVRSKPNDWEWHAIQREQSLVRS